MSINVVGRAVLGCSALMALGMSTGAEACSDAAWLGTAGANAYTLGGPQVGTPNGSSAFKRYRGLCGMEANVLGNSFVGDNSPAAEATYRARVQIYPGATGANPKVLGVYSADNGGGTELLAVRHNSATGAFEFAVNGGTLSTPAGSVPANSGWYGVEIFFADGQPFSATIQPPATAVANPTNLTVTSPGNVAGLVESVRLGSIDPTPGATGTVRVDEFESSRAATAIGFLCRGDVNGDGVIDTLDAAFTVAERRGTAVAPAVADVNADGLVNVTDGALVVLMRRATPRKTCP